MANFIIHHRHEPSECAASIASWRGFDSPLRGTKAPFACRFGDHETWLRVNATDLESAIALIPGFVAERATITRVEERQVP